MGWDGIDLTGAGRGLCCVVVVTFVTVCNWGEEIQVLR